MSIIKDTFFGGAEKEAGKVQAAASEEAVAEQRRQFDISQEQFAPFREAGVSALEQQQALLGLSGQEAEQQALSQFQESPGQAFLRQRQERALLRNASAIGGLGGGNVRTALQEQAAGIASTQLGDFQNRLASLTGSGQTATSNLAQLGGQTAANIGAALQQAGAARASGITGQAAGFREGVGQVAQFAGFSDIVLKKNIVKIGELPSGLNWYKWEWIDSAKDIVNGQLAEGVIAQEAAEMFPEAVTKEGKYLKVNYAELH